MRASSSFPNAVEDYYSNGVNKLTIEMLNGISGATHFSIAELILICLAIIITYVIIHATFVLLMKKTINATGYILRILSSISVLYFGFVLLWGLNYYRLPFADLAHLQVRPSSVPELAGVCAKIIDRANALREQVIECEDGVMRARESKSYLFGHAAAGYQEAAKKIPALGGSYGRPKGVILSKVLSYLGISGVYFPFTGEANVNTLLPDALLPSTICHELAHQRGFAREDEAEYIAYVTCNSNANPEYRYSGTLLALLRAMGMLGAYDSGRYERLREKYSAGVQRDLRDISSFWDEYAGAFSTLTRNINDIYLKSNRQKEGVYSYDRMVDLLIAEYRAKRPPPRSTLDDPANPAPAKKGLAISHKAFAIHDAPGWIRTSGLRFCSPKRAIFGGSRAASLP